VIQPRDIPNLISVVRILLTIPVVYFLLERNYGAALILFTVAGVSDGLDGFLAKHYQWQSRLGGLLDPLADKLLLMSSFLVLSATGLVPVWLLMAAICRDLVILGGAMYYNFMIEEVQPAPSIASKLNTALQILLVILVMLNAGPLALPPGLIDALQWCLLATILVSGVHYVVVWSDKALRAGRSKRP
jgi:cardiolipin synthase